MTGRGSVGEGPIPPRRTDLMTHGADSARQVTEVLYISSASTPAEFERIKGRRRPGAQEITYGMSEASFKFHNQIQRGLVANNCRVLSLVGRPASRQFYQDWYWAGVTEQLAPNHTVKHLGFPNLPGVKQLSLAGGLAKEAKRWERRTRGTDRRIAIIDGAYVSAMPGVLTALRGSDVVTVGVFADLYTYMADVQDAASRRSPVHRMIRSLNAWSLQNLDAFVVLTEAMLDVLHVGDRPYVIMEGLVDVDAAGPPASVSRHQHPTALYAGALRRVYGLADLVDGFLAYDNPDARLFIYGQGDFEPDIARAASRDKRLTWGGRLPLAEVQEEERRAWVLVNPRPVDQEFTQYSFPSKNMEYMASGTATLTTRLPGMPPEYYDYVLTIDQPGAAGITEALARVLSKPLAELDQLGESARTFVKSQKNSTAQMARVLEMAAALRGRREGDH